MHDVKKTKELIDERLDKVSGGGISESGEEYTWSCSKCGYSITTIGYGYSYDKCPFCGEKAKVDIPEDMPELNF